MKRISMKSLGKTLSVIAMSVILACGIASNPAYAISPGEEDALSKEVLRQVKAQYTLLEDPKIVEMVNIIGHRIADSLPERLFTYHFYVIEDDSFNAFATPSGHIFVNTGLIERLESEEELAGVLAHEIAHVSCRHISETIHRMRKVQKMSIAGLAASILLGMTGAGEAASAVMVGTVAGQQSASLAYSREFERQADETAMEHLFRAGYSPECMIAGLKRMQSIAWRETTLPPYLFTHPPTKDRVAYTTAWLKANPSKCAPRPKEWDTDFVSVQTRLIALYGNQSDARQRFQKALSEDPQNANAHLGYGLLLARIGHCEEAIRHLEMAWTQDTSNLSIQKDLGRVYCLNGQYEEALAVLEPALRTGSYDFEGHYYLGFAQLKSGRLADAEKTFEKMIKRRSLLSRAGMGGPPDKKGPPEGEGPDQKNPPERPSPDQKTPPSVALERRPQKESFYTKTLYSLGECYYKHGNMGRSHFYLGLYYKDKRDFINAVFQMEKALALIDDPEEKMKIEDELKQMQKAASMQQKRAETMRGPGYRRR
jgi:predicted Zn-dependent protease